MEGKDREMELGAKRLEGVGMGVKRREVVEKRVEGGRLEGDREMGRNRGEEGGNSGEMRERVGGTGKVLGEEGGEWELAGKVRKDEREGGAVRKGREEAGSGGRRWETVARVGEGLGVEEKGGVRIEGKVVIAGQEGWKRPERDAAEEMEGILVRSRDGMGVNELIRGLVEELPAREIGTRK